MTPQKPFGIICLLYKDAVFVSGMETSPWTIGKGEVDRDLSILDCGYLTPGPAAGCSARVNLLRCWNSFSWWLIYSAECLPAFQRALSLGAACREVFGVGRLGGEPHTGVRAAVSSPNREQEAEADEQEARAEAHSPREWPSAT